MATLIIIYTWANNIMIKLKGGFTVDSKIKLSSSKINILTLNRIWYKNKGSLYINDQSLFYLTIFYSQSWTNL